MSEMEIMEMVKENERLKEDNETLLHVIAQMRVTLNRLVNRFIVEQPVD